MNYRSCCVYVFHNSIFGGLPSETLKKSNRRGVDRIAERMSSRYFRMTYFFKQDSDKKKNVLFVCF